MVLDPVSERDGGLFMILKESSFKYRYNYTRKDKYVET